jgi:hypothetical protein
MSQAVIIVSLILSCIAITIVVATGMELFFALLVSGWRSFDRWAERTAQSIDRIYHSFHPKGRTIEKGMVMEVIWLLLLAITTIAFQQPTIEIIQILLIVAAIAGIVIAIFFTIILLLSIVLNWIAVNVLPPIMDWAAQFIYRRDREIAANPETDPAILLKLSGSRDRLTRKEVAGNPNTPVDVLWHLIRQYPYQVLENPLFLLIVLENPNWIMEIPETDLHELLQQSSVPEAIVDAALHHTQSYIRGVAIQAAANNPKTSASRLEEVTLNHNLLYADVLQNPKIAEASLQRFATCNNDAIQEQLARYCLRHESLFAKSLSVKPQDILQWIVQDVVAGQKDELMFLLLTYPDLPPQFIPQLLVALPHKLHLRLAKSSEISGELLKLLTDYPTYINSMKTRICQAIARNLNTPPEILDEFADRPSKAIRISLALREKYSPELLVKLAIDPYPEIRRNLLQNRYIEPSLLNSLRNHSRLEVQEFVAAHPNTPRLPQ